MWSAALFACIPRLQTHGGVDVFAPGEGFGVDDVAPDFTLGDQNDITHSLSQYRGSVVLLDVSTIWCAPCQALAESTQATADKFRNEGFVYVTILQEDVEGGDVDLADLNLWGDTFGIVEPILDDSKDPRKLGAAVVDGEFPAVLVVDRDGIVVKRVETPNAALVDAAVEAAL